MAVCSWQVSLVFLLAMVLRVGWFCCGTWVVSDIFLPVFVLSIGWFGKDYRAVIILFLKDRKSRGERGFHANLVLERERLLVST